MKSKGSKGTRETSKRLLFVKLSSLNDLARYVCKFDSTTTEAFYERNKLFSFGEQIGDISLVYYAEVKERTDFLHYSYGSEGDREHAELTNETNTQQLHLCHTNIIEMDLHNFPKAAKIDRKDINYIKVGSIKDLTKIILKKSIEAETISCAYVLECNNKTIVGAFDLIEELTDDKKMFYYAIAGKEENDVKNASFIRYDYSLNSFGFTNEFGEHSYMYVKLIHLAEPFPGINL